MSWWSLPEDWKATPLGPLVKIKTGFACAKKNLVPADQGIAQLRPFNIATHGKIDLSEVYYIPPDYKDGTEAYALEPGHVLFNNTNSVELVGKTALVTEPMQCVFSNHIYRLTVKAKAHLDPAWLALALRALWNRGYFEEYCNRWIGQAGFNQKMLKAVEIPIPHPEDPARSLETQRRIVARIEGLFAELGAARHLHAALVHDAERLMDAVLADTFDKVTPPSSETLEEITQITSGGTPLRSRSEYYTGEIPWVKTGELNDGIILESEEHITQQAIDDSSAKLFPVGTLLIAMYGQGKTDSPPLGCC